MNKKPKSTPCLLPTAYCTLFSKIPTWTWLTVFVAIALIQVWLLRDVVMGDAFIHFTFARGISEGQPFFYNGEFSAGSTSPLWSALLAPLWFLLNDGVIWGVKVLAGFFTGLSVILTFSVAKKISKNKILALSASALVAGSYVFSYWAAKGMETSLYVCLVLGSFLVYLKLINQPKENSPLGKRGSGGVKYEIFLGILLGLTILTRPEGWFLALFLGIPLLIKNGWRTILTIGSPALIVIAPYYLYLFKQTGQFLPSSAARILRARQWAHNLGGIHFIPEIFKILATKLLPATPFFIYFFVKKNPPFRKGGLGGIIFFPILAWLTFHFIFFSTIMPTTEGYRYLLGALPFFYIISLLGIWKISSKKVRVTALLFLLAGSFAISGQQLAERMSSIKNCEAPFIDSVRRETGLWLKENTEPTDLIAIKEVDQSAYYSGRKVLSIDGTLDSKAIPFVKSNDQLGFLKKYQPDYFVLEEEMYRDYPDWQNSNVLPLINQKLQIGETQELEGMRFELVHKLDVGNPQACPHIQGDYSWYIFKIE